MSRRVILMALLLAAPLSAAREIGYPLLRSLDNDLEAWGGGGQNFGIAIDPRGILYLANLNGLVIFDGAHGTVVPIGQQLTAFSVALGPDGSVAVGGDSEFGLIEAGPQGEPVFRSLVDEGRRAGGDFGQTYVDSFATGFGFLAGHRLDVWDGNELFEAANFEPGRPFPRAFSVDGSLYIWDRVDGLRRLVERRLEPVPGGDAYRGRRIDGLDSSPGGGFVVSVRGEGLFLLRDSVSTAYATEASAWTREHRVQEVRRLPDGRFAVGSLLGGILLMRADGSIEQAIDTAAGLSDNFVFGTAVDSEGLLWLGQNHGVSTLEIASPLSAFDERSGLEGSVQAIHSHRGELWVGTSSGVFTTAGAPRRHDGMPFRPLPEIRDGGWSFASAGDDLLIASAFGASVLSQGRVAEIDGASEWTVYAMATSRRDPDRVWMGLTAGLGAARRTAAGWVFEGRIAGFEEEVFHIVELPDGALWLSNSVSGVSRVDFSGPELSSARVTRFPDETGEDSYVALTRAGLLRVRGRDISPLDPATGATAAAPLLTLASDINLLVEDAKGQLWVNSRPVSTLAHKPQGWSVTRRLFNLPSRGIERIYADPTGVVWLGGDGGLFRHAGDAATEDVPLPRPRFGRLVADSQLLLFGGAISAEPAPATLAAGVRRLRVQFAPHSFRPGLRYQTRLEPLDEDWGPWSPDPYVEFTRLPAGTYTLRLRTGGPSGEVSEPAAWAFTVQPPWYQRPWALGLWLLAVLAAVRGYGELRVRAANARAARLERIVAEQTAELKSANQRLLDLSTRDELTGLANRRLFDERLAEEWARARRQGTPLALILADLDHFKRLNDSLGHPAGDACLREVARSFRDTLRRSLDLVARYGGEEFALLLPDTAVEAALVVAEELRHGVESLGIAADAEGATQVTASFGVAVVQPGEDNQPQTLIEAADQALYRAKRGGRNQVVGDSI